jgi:hypothetical protein
MRAINCGGFGSYDSGSPAQQSARNTEINQSLYGCP